MNNALPTRRAFSFDAMRLSACRYRLLFQRPFTTAHGTRDGTDSVFVKWEKDGCTGYGEATLPPYLKEHTDQVLATIRAFRPAGAIDGEGSTELIGCIEAHTRNSPAARNALTMAVRDLEAQMAGVPLWKHLDLAAPSDKAITLFTVAVRSVDEVAGALDALPKGGALKVKLGAAHDMALLRQIKHLDARDLLLDANQGLRSLDEALEVVIEAGGRAIGIEQPFAKDRWDLHKALQERIRMPVIGDESIQDLGDVERSAGTFGGVNIKLMKCGGTPWAIPMADLAGRMGSAVMFGSMSESSLGCLAALHLTGRADLIDLDGPFLISNDPFSGLELNGNGHFKVPDRPGIGASVRADLPFAPFGS